MLGLPQRPIVDNPPNDGGETGPEVLHFCKHAAARRPGRRPLPRPPTSVNSLWRPPPLWWKSLVRRSFLLALTLVIGLSPALAVAQGADEPSLVALRALDRRVATIGHRLAVANAPWCRDRAWLAGFVLHDLAQYGPEARPAAIRAFGLDRGAGILALAESGPAERAGLRTDDLVESFDGEPLPLQPPGPAASFAGAERILAAMEAALADGRLAIRGRRGETPLSIAVQAERGCASRFQILPSPRLNAYADGRYVQVTSAVAAYAADDAELAAILAHEFAHNVLRHRARLDAAGVRRGILANFGRNARLIRETEEEADRLSVWLLARAGYDPAATARFWRRFGRRGLNIFGSPTHGGWRGRVERFEAEIAAMRAAGPGGRPAFLPPPTAD